MIGALLLEKLEQIDEAIKLIIQTYESEFLEPVFKPEFIEKMEERENEPVVQVADFRRHFGLEENV